MVRAGKGSGPRGVYEYNRGARSWPRRTQPTDDAGRVISPKRLQSTCTRQLSTKSLQQEQPDDDVSKPIDRRRLLLQLVWTGLDFFGRKDGNFARFYSTT